MLRANFLERMAQAGALAPSGDNLQPWSFRADGDALLVKHDSQRDLSLFNVQHLASFIALGAALENIVIAASSEGYDTEVEYFLDEKNADLIARIGFEPGAAKDPLADYLEKRCTNRKPYAARPIDAEIVGRLTATTKRFPKVDLLWVQDKSRLERLGRIVARADRLIFENPRIHGHLFSTIRWTREEVERTRDGLPVESLELGRVGSLGLRSLKRWYTVEFLNRFGFSKAAARHSLVLMQRCSAAGLIMAPDTSRSSFLDCGRAFQRIWLQATKENLSVQPMTAIIFFQLRSRLGEYDGLLHNQITSVNEFRRDLDSFFTLSKDGVPAMLFRVGLGTLPSARTIRRIIPRF